MKTVLIYDQLDSSLKFFVLDGDYSHLNGVYINQYVEDEKAQKATDTKQDELTDLIYVPETGEFKHSALDEFPTQAVREGATVIVAGFLP